MPGVPPDALAQVKRGLRSLFGRKKRQQQQQQQEQQESHQQQQQQPTSTSDPPPTITTTAPPASAPSDNEPQAAPPPTENTTFPPPPTPSPLPTTSTPLPPPPAGPAPTSTSTSTTSPNTNPTSTTGHHIPAPTQITEAKSIDLNPSGPASVAAAAEPTATAGGEAPRAMPAAVDTGAAKSMGGAAPGGMSATSGPLEDQLAHGYVDESVGGKKEGVVA